MRCIPVLVMLVVGVLAVSGAAFAADTDSNGAEVSAGTDPLDNASYPAAKGEPVVEGEGEMAGEGEPAAEGEAEPIVEGEYADAEIWVRIPDRTVVPGSEVVVPINVNSKSPINPNGIHMVFRYDPSLEQVRSMKVEPTEITGHMSFVWDADEAAGRVTISVMGTGDYSALSKEKGHFFDVRFRMPEEAAMDACRTMWLEMVRFYDSIGDPVPVDFSGEARVCAGLEGQMGDLNGDGMVDVGDSSRALAIAVGSKPSTQEAVRIGDWNGDGAIDSADAVILQRFSVGYAINPAPFESGEADPFLLRQILSGTDAVEVSLEDVRGAAGEIVKVPLSISDATGVSGYDVLIEYDTAKLMAMDAAPGTVVLQTPEDATPPQQQYRIDAGAGKILVSLARENAVWDAKKAIIVGSLAVMRFKILENVPVDAVLPLSVRKVALKGQYGGDFSWMTGVFPVDGSIRVLASTPGTEGETAEGEASLEGEADVSLWLPDRYFGDDGWTLIPISIVSPSKIAPRGIDVTVKYDPEVLDASTIDVQPTAITGRTSFTWSKPEPGLVRIGAMGDMGGLTGEGHLFDIKGRVLDNPARPCSAFAFSRGHVFLYDDNILSIPVDSSDTGETCKSPTVFLGDVNGDGAVTMADPMTILALAVGKTVKVGARVVDRVEARRAGDLNGDNYLDSADAVMLQRYIFDKPVNPPAYADGVAADPMLLSVALEGQDRLTVSAENETGMVGGKASVSVYASSAYALCGYDFKLRFDKTVLKAVGARKGDVVGDAPQDYEAGDGYVQVSMGRKEAYAAKAMDVLLAVVDFEVLAMPASGDQIEVKIEQPALKGQYGDSFEWYTTVLPKHGTFTVSAANEGEGESVAEGEGEAEGEKPPKGLLKCGPAETRPGGMWGDGLLLVSALGLLVAWRKRGRAYWPD